MANEIVILKLEVDANGTVKGFEQLEKQAGKSGKKSGEKFTDKFEDGLGGVLKAGAKLAGILTGVLGAVSFAKAIKGAQVQEDAINSLNTSLQLTGKFTAKTSQEMQDFASSLQATSKFGDEAILQNSALIQSLANLDSKGLQRATQASADFASALNVDLGTASSLVAKALTGQTGALSRYGIQVEKGATQAQTLSNVLGALESKFGGSALSKINTFSGAVAQTTNIFGDLLEEIGFLITRQPLVVEGIKSIGTVFTSAIGVVKEFGESFSFFKDIIEPLAGFNNALIQFVITPFELVYNVAKTSFDGVVFLVNSLVASTAEGLAGFANLANKFGVDNELTKGLQAFAETSDQVFTESADRANASFQSILDFPISAGLATKNEEILASVRDLNSQLEIERMNNALALLNTSEQIATGIQDDTNQITGFFASMNAGFTSSVENMKAGAIQLTQQFKAGLVKGIAGGVQTLVMAMAKGEDGFKAFVNFALNTIADLAIQMGTTLIGIGLGIESLKGLDGAQAVVAGIGLVALGSIIKAFTGGSAGASAPTGGGAPASDDFSSRATPLSEPEDIEARESGPRVQLVVQGDILDSEQTGNRILDILNKNFSDSGGSISGASFA